MRALTLKNKFKFVDGSIEIPKEHDLNFLAWDHCNNLVHSWIINSLAPSIAEGVLYIKNVIDVWKDIIERFL
jgi:hypothetical protein